VQYISLFIDFLQIYKRDTLFKIWNSACFWISVVIPLLFISIIFGVSIPRNCTIGIGLIIYHYSNIVTNGSVVIGENCVICRGVTIGNKNFENDVPVLGDNVDIGAGAVIIGKIKIGNNVKIGANAVVLKDVPDNHIAVGNPARNI
jgi:serine acetyltransferase